MSIKKAILATSVLASAMVATPAVAAVSANAGFVSEYRFRGVQFGEAGAYIGVDVEQSGFYAGAWTIDDSSDNEYDLYGGYGLELESGFSFGVGYTNYSYENATGEQQEINVFLGYDMFGLEVSVGEDVDAADDGDDIDYQFYAASVSGDVFGALIGFYEYDADGSDANDYFYVEFSASGEVGGFDVAAIGGFIQYDDADATGADFSGDTDPYVLIDISKTFDL